MDSRKIAFSARLPAKFCTRCRYETFFTQPGPGADISLRHMPRLNISSDTWSARPLIGLGRQRAALTPAPLAQPRRSSDVCAATTTEHISKRLRGWRQRGIADAHP